MIDLRPIAKSLPVYLADSIGRFAKKHPDAVVSCIALYVRPYNGGSAWINFETKDHSDAWVAKHGNDQGYVKEDEAGRFCPFPNDFAFGQAEEFNIPDFPDLYESYQNDENDEELLEFRDPAGNVHHVDSCNESIGGLLLEVLTNILKCFGEFGSLKRAGTFRMGVCVHETDCEMFWIHEPENTKPEQRESTVEKRPFFWYAGEKYSRKMSSKEIWTYGESSD